MSNPYSVGTSGFLVSDFDNALSPTGDAGSAKRTNALSNKLTNVLSSPYTDSDTRDALRLLDARSPRDAEETRLSLKHDAQQEVIDANAQIVDDFGKVAHQLKRVGALITILNQTCDSMRYHIQLAKQEAAPMLEEASTLLARKQETESKQQLLTAFNEHFLTSDEDLTTLTSSAEPVNDAYFTVLTRVKQIHKDCEILLGYENQRLGLELMEQTTRNLDAGYNKLYNWIQREFKILDLEDPHMSGSIRLSLRALSERPTLFQNCLDFFGEARQATLSEAFQKALTDSTLSSSKAIEFSTHDPLRYIGDMLAWVHSTTVSEKEALEGLFISDADEISKGLNAGKSNEPWARLRHTSSAAADGADGEEEEDDENKTSNEPAFDGHAALNSLISRNMASVAQVLNQRISLTTRNLTDQITIYKSYNLLLFYQDIFIKLLGATHLSTHNPKSRSHSEQLHSQNSLLVALSTLQTQSLTHFEATVTEDIEAHSTSLDPSPTLQPPGILQSNLVLFSSILHLRAPSLTAPEFSRLYSILVTPIIELCNTTASTLSSTSDQPDDDPEDPPSESFESTIYRLNYLHPIHSTLKTLSKDLSLAAHVAAPSRSAEQEGSDLIEELAGLVADRFLLVSGVRPLVEFLKDLQHASLEAKRAALVSRLEDASTALDGFLASALIDVQDDLSRVSDKGAVKAVVAEAVVEFCEEFQKVVGVLDAVDEEFEDQKGRASDRDDDSDQGAEDDILLREIYPRTVEEVKALLS